MALNDRKITPGGVRLHGVQSAPDRLIGNAQENKKVFDNYILTVLQGLMNGLIDDLTATTAGKSGAAQIGTEGIEGLSGSNVMAALVSMKTQLDRKASAATTEAALESKAEKSDVEQLIKSVAFDAQTGTFTFTRADGSGVSIDTALEKVAVNFRYDQRYQELVLELADGSEQRISLSAFVTETEFESSDQIQWSVRNHVVTATVKNGSITEQMLSEELARKLSQQITGVEQNAERAEDAANQARLSAEQASVGARDAQQSARNAISAQRAVEDMGITAESIPAEEEAYTEKTTAGGAVRLKLFVPRGQTGERGPEGEPGPRGADGIMAAKVEGTTLKLEAATGSGYRIGDGLRLDTETNTLSVDTADQVEQDNTRPVTSAAVATTVGNIEAILATI